MRNPAFRGRRRRLGSRRERAAEPAVARQIPDEDRAVEAGAVQRPAVGADLQPGDLAGVAVERVAGRRRGHVPDDHALVLAGRGGDAAAPAEGRSHDRADVAPGRPAHPAGDEVEEPHRAVPAAEQQRPVVRAEGRRRRRRRTALSGRSVRASRMTVGPPSMLVTDARAVLMKIGVTELGRAADVARRGRARVRSARRTRCRLAAFPARLDRRRPARSARPVRRPRGRLPRRRRWATSRRLAASRMAGCPPPTASRDPSWLNRSTSRRRPEERELVDLPRVRPRHAGSPCRPAGAAPRCRRTPACARPG